MKIAFNSPEWQLLKDTARVLVTRAHSSGLDSLSAKERAFFCVWIAHGEVENGGFHAVCYNSTGDYLRYLPDAFRTIGDMGRSELFEKLSGLFSPEAPSSDQGIRVRQHQALSAEATAQIDALDRAYYSSPEDVTGLLYAFRRSWNTVQGT